MKTVYAAAFLLFGLLALSYAQEQAPPLTDPSSPPAETHKMSRTEKSRTSAAKGGVVDLNTASKQELAALPGVGPSYAQKIIDARPFESKDQLLKKRLIPQSTYDKIKDQVTVSEVKKQSLPPGQQH